RIPAESLQKGEAFRYRVIADNFIDTHDSARAFTVCQAHRLLDENQIEIVDVGFGNVDRITRQTLDQFFDSCRMKSGHDAVTGLHRLESNDNFHPADFTDDNHFRALPQRRLEQLEHADIAASLIAAAVTGRFLHPVLMRNLHFRRIFNRHNLGFWPDKCCDGVEQGGFAGGCRTYDKSIQPGFEHQRHVGSHQVIDRAEFDQFKHTDGSARRFTDCEIAAPFGNFAPVDNIDT